jgi:hypothetical protein
MLSGSLLMQFSKDNIVDSMLYFVSREETPKPYNK